MRHLELRYRLACDLVLCRTFEATKEQNGKTMIFFLDQHLFLFLFLFEIKDNMSIYKSEDNKYINHVYFTGQAETQSTLDTFKVN
jgi:hypothetical protein